MTELAKTVGVWRGTAMMLNIVLGAGLLALPGLAVQSAGNGALLVWFACAAASIPLLVVFGILGQRFPDAGGLAHVLSHAFGSLGYTVATLLFLGAVVLGLPAIALAGGHYATAVFGGDAHLYAGLFLITAAVSNSLSPQVAGRVNEVIASVLIFVLVAIALAGIAIVIGPGQGDTPAPPAGLEIPTIAVFSATFMMVFFAFTGWEVSANLSGEFRNARRDFPLAMIFSFLIAVLLYGTLAWVVHRSGLRSGFEAPFAELFGMRFGQLGAAVIGLVSCLLIFANLSSAVWAVSRMVFSASENRLLPAAISRLSGETPFNAVMLTVSVLLGMVLAAFSGLIDIGTLLEMAGQNFILLYAGSAAALIKLASALWQTLLGWGSVVMVAALSLARGLDALAYPAALIAIAVLVVCFRSWGGMARTAERQNK